MGGTVRHGFDHYPAWQTPQPYDREHAAMANRSAVRRRLLQLLEQHGFTPAAAQAAREQGLKLRDLTSRYGIEFGIFIDAETGEPLGAVMTGTAEHLDVTRALNATMPGRRYVCVHAHPASTSLWVLDVSLLVNAGNVVAIVAVGSDGTWYVGSLDPEAPRPSERELFDAWRSAYYATVDKYDTARGAGQLTRRQAQRLHSHEIWELAGPALGLRYDRLESGRPP